MEKYEWEYMVTSIVIDEADEIARVLSGRFNQEGYEGWELVQWNIMPPAALLTASTTQYECYDKIEWFDFDELK